MRVHPITAEATFILVVVGVKLFFLSGPIAAPGAGSTRSVSVDISGMFHTIKNLPVEKIHDMTFVFSNGG
jgi:hypothetical protein